LAQPSGRAPNTKWEKQSGVLTLTVPEQLGITYELAEANVVDATNWIVLTNFVRKIRTNTAEVILRHPAPASTGFFRVTAAGR
jgi:hypothetical protein